MTRAAILAMVGGVWRVLPLVCLLLACEELSEFRTGDDEVFRGVVAGSDTDPDDGSFIRQGFASFTELELTFDPDLAARRGDSDALPSPGTVHTRYQCPRGDDSCERGEEVDGPLVEAPLIPIPSLANDALSGYDFPGGGRIRNYIFSTPLQDGGDAPPRSALVFVSLMDSGKVEVRVIAPGSAGGDADAPPALFGVFVLKRQAR